MISHIREKARIVRAGKGKKLRSPGRVTLIDGRQKRETPRRRPTTVAQLYAISRQKREKRECINGQKEKAVRNAEKEKRPQAPYSQGHSAVPEAGAYAKKRFSPRTEKKKGRISIEQHVPVEAGPPSAKVQTDSLIRKEKKGGANDITYPEKKEKKDVWVWLDRR